MPDWTVLHGAMFDISRILARRGVEITIIRGDSQTLDPQTVIAVPTKITERERAGQAGITGNFSLVIIGYRGHAGQADLNIKRGDRFKLNGTLYHVIYVDSSLPGRAEAYAESTQGK